jgi:flagellar hook-associated protein 3 FlgL
MGGALNNIYDTVSFALYLHSKEMTRLQEQASTGSRVNRISDAPSDAYRILGLKSQDRSLEDYLDALSEMNSTLEISLTVIEDMTSALAGTKTSLTQINSGLQGEQGRQRIAEGINDTLEQMVSFANAKHADQYLFGGGNTGSAPYVVQRNGDKITSVIYQGGSDIRNIEVAPGVESSAFYVGRDIFGSDQRGELIFMGGTGAKAGTGTSNVRSDVWLTVIHDGSNYKISIDDGASYVTVPLGGDPNQAVTDSRTGKVLYVDTTEINNTGLELVRVPGTYDVFSTLIGIRDILKNERGLSETQLQELLDSSMDSLEEVRLTLVQTSASMGSKIGFLDELQGNLKNMKYDTEDEVTRLQEADIAQIAIDLSRHQVLYEMSLSVAGKLMSMSLLDFIR